MLKRHNFQLPLNAELWLIGGLVVAGIAVERVLWFAAAVGFLYVLLRRAAYGRWRATPPDLAIALLILLLPAMLKTADFSQLTYPSILRILAGFALYYAIANAAYTPVSLNLLVGLLACAGLLLAAGGVLLLDAKELPLVLQGRLPTMGSGADSVNTNILAGAISMLTPLFVAVALFSSSPTSVRARLLRLLCFGVAALLLLALAVTGSRGGQMAGVCGIVCVLLLRWPRLMLLIPIFVGGGLAAVAFAYTSGEIQALTGAGSVSGLSTRLEIWQRALSMIQDVPFTGVGMGLFGRIADTLYPFFRSPANTIPHAHNIFLQIAVDLGIPGLIMWLAILASMLQLSYKLYAHNRHDTATLRTACGAGLFASQIAMLTHGLVDAPLWNTRVAILVWALWGLVMFCVNRIDWGEKE